MAFSRSCGAYDVIRCLASSRPIPLSWWSHDASQPHSGDRPQQPLSRSLDPGVGSKDMSSSRKAIARSPRARTWPRGCRALRCAGCWEVGLASRTRLRHERPDAASAAAVATRSGPAARLRPPYNARPATCRNPGSGRAPERRGSPIGGPAARKSGPSHTAIRGLQVPRPLVPFQLFSPKPRTDPGRKPGVKEKPGC